MPDAISKKEQLRNEMRAQLGAQSTRDRDRKSRDIVRKIKKDDGFRNAKTVMFYFSTEHEVQTKTLIEESLLAGKRVALPYVDGNHSEIRAAAVGNLAEDVHKGSYGLMEPKSEKLRLIDTAQIDIVLVPGLAFDHAKNRLGRGKGYYDRFLAKLPRGVKTFGLAFDFQIVKSLPVTELDIPLTRIFHN